MELDVTVQEASLTLLKKASKKGSIESLNPATRDSRYKAIRPGGGSQARSDSEGTSSTNFEGIQYLVRILSKTYGITFDGIDPGTNGSSVLSECSSSEPGALGA